MAQAKLQIEIISADNLYNADGMLAGKSDPYVIVEVPGQPTMKFQTPVINNCLNPVWNHIGEIDGFMDGDTLEFQVWDSDTWPKPDQLLGKAMLTAQDFYPNGLEGPLMLSESQTEASLTVRVIVLDTTDPSQDPNMVMDPNMVAQGQEGMEYQQVEYQQGMVEGGIIEGGMMAQVEGPQTLHVNVMNARGLYNADGFLAGKSDPYCICVVPEKKHLKFQTSTINNCLDPDWNHTGLIHGFEAGDSLEFQVWDSDTKPKPDQLLGKVTLTPQDFANNPDGIAGVLQLSGGLSKEAGTLEVKIAVDVAATMDDAAQAAAHEAHAHGSSAQAAAGHAEQPGVKRLSAGSQHLDKLAGAKMAKLKVTVFSASGLYNADGFLAGKSDPYVICQVPENKKVQKFKTKVMSNTLEPTWNHLGVINSFIVGHNLELEVYDSDTPPKPDQLLGKITLTSDEFFPYGLEGAFILGESKAVNATLTVRIEVLPDTAATGLTGAKISTGATYQTGQVRPGMYQMGQPGAVYYQQQPYVTTGSAQYAQYVTGAPTYTYATQAPTTVVQQAVAQAAFDAMDSNHDGVITRSEFEKVAAEPVAAPAAQPVATKVEYASAPITYTTAQAATYTAPTTTYTAAPAATYTAAPAATYTAAPAATYTAAPAATYTAAPTTYTAPVMASSCTVAAGSASAAYSAPAATYTMAAPSPVTYMQRASTTIAGPTMTMQAKPATTVTPAEPVAAAATPAPTMYTIQRPAAAAPVAISGSQKFMTGASSTLSQPVTYAAAQPITTAAAPITTAAAPMMTAAASYTTAAAPVTTAAAPMTTAAAPITIASAPTAATTTMAAPRLSVAMGNTARVTYSAAPGAAYTMAPGAAYTMAPGAAAPGQTLFDRLDKNHDGVVSRSEFNSALR